MAKQVSSVFIRLGIENFVGIEKLKGAFRELDKSIGPTSRSIDTAIASIKQYASSTTQSEQLIRGQIEAFKGLRSQVDVNGSTYNSLTLEVANLQAQLRGSSDAIERQRESLLRNSAAGTQNAKSLETQISALERLRQQTRPGSSAFIQLSNDIEKATVSLGRFKSEASQAASVVTQRPAMSFEKIANQVAVLQRRMQSLNLSSADFLKYQQRISLINTVQSTLTGRQGVRAAAEMYASPQYANFVAGPAGKLELPDTTAALSQRLQELQEQLANTSRGTDTYLALQRELIIVQRDAAAATQGLGATLLQDLHTGTAVRSHRNLQEVISQTQREMLDLDTTTKSGFDTYTQHAARIRDLEEELGRLGRSYATAATNAKTFANTQENATLNQAINAATTGRLRVRQRAQAQARQDLSEAILGGAANTPLLLPAAGQTSAPGTGQVRSGGAMAVTSDQIKAALFSGTGRNNLDVVFGGIPEYRKRGYQTGLPSVEYGAPTPGFTEATARAVNATSASYKELIKDIRLAKAASDGSINTIEAERTAWTRLQRAVEQGSDKYRLATKRIEEIDQRLGRGGARGLGGRQLAEIAGASISGGIFGGPEGFLGGVVGGAIGGVGGSFAGAAAGAQVGMARQSVANTADYAAQIGKLQIALRGVSGNQENYNKAISAAASATRELNVPQTEATQGITRLSAAVLGAGGTMDNANFAFRSMSEAIKATGGNAEQVDGALLALTQVFSKGKVSAEELNQIAERLPGTFTLFAQASGKTGPELQKALQQGQVGLNDLMKFLELASQKHGQTARDISKSSDEAGARMTIAFQAMALAVGNAIKPVGAQLQDAFAKFATDVTPMVTDTAKGIGALFKVIIDNGAAIGAIAKLALEFGAATLALKAFAALSGPLSFAFDLIKISMTNMREAIGIAKLELQGFAATAKATAASLAAPLVLTIAIVGADIVLTALRAINDAQDRITKLKTSVSAPEWYKRAGGEALTQSQVTKLAGTVAAEFDAAYKVLRPLEEWAAANRSSKLSGKFGGPTFDEQLKLAQQKRPYDITDVLFNQKAVELLAAQKLVDQLTARYQYAIKKLPNAPATRPGAAGSFPSPAAADDGSKGKAARDRAAADAQRTAETLNQQQIRLDDTVFAHRQDLARRQYELQKELIDLETKNRLDMLSSVERESASAVEQRRQRELEYQNRIREAEAAVAKARQDLNSAQRAAAVTTGGAAGLPAGMTQYISGDPSSPYYRADHSAANYHEHLAFASRAAAEAAYAVLTRAGYKVSEFKGYGPVGRHTPGSAHYLGLAMDIAGSQVAPGRERALSAGVARAMGIGGGALQRRGLIDVGDAGIAQANLSKAQADLDLLRQNAARANAAAYTEQVNALTKAFRDQNEELEKSVKNETLRASLQAKGYSEAYVKLQLDINAALEQRNLRISQVPLVEKQTIDSINTAYEKQVELLRQVYDLNESLGRSFGFREGAQRYIESIGTMREATAGLTQQGFKGLEDVLFQLTTTGTANFQQFAASILEQTARMIIQQLVLKTIMQAIGAIGGGSPTSSFNMFTDFSTGPSFNMFTDFAASAKGNVFGANGIVPYAKGGVVTRPMLFPFANGGTIGTGLMGEAGPEAIMPLSRGPNGKLGVAASGSGNSPTVIINIDATGGTSSQGKDDNANQLGRVIAVVVQQEIAKQKRPGGLLAQ